MTSAVTLVDSLIRDYLVFRGFAGSLKQFDADSKAEKEQKFKVDAITERLCSLISGHDISSLRALWEHLSEKVFAHLDNTQTKHADRLENDLYKLYLANCVQQAKSDKIAEFFEIFASRFHLAEGWSDWFALPYLSTPQERAPFRAYFSKQWQEVFLVSLHNFLSLAFHQMELPALLAYSDQLKGFESDMDVTKTLLNMKAPPPDVVASAEVMDDFASIAHSQSPLINQSSSRSLRSVIRRKFASSTKKAEG
uniref:WD repeat-containing protein 91 n=2 Tax=Plectus sambesii TaxID=2011161 RepID=A0A914X694_9BILA